MSHWWNIHFTFSTMERGTSVEREKFTYCFASLLQLLTGSGIFWKVENEIMEDFVTENRNQPINRNPSMWRNRDISEEYIRNAFESRLWGWVYRISDVGFTIFSIY